MRKVLFAASLVGLFAGTAMADIASLTQRDRSSTPILQDGVNGVSINFTEIDGPQTQGGAAGDIYNSIAPGTGGYVAFAPGTGALGFDDYTNNTGPAGTSSLDEFGFVGGANTIGTTFGAQNGGTMFVTHFNSAGTTIINSFGVTLPQAGNFIWTITLGTAGYSIPNSGIVQLFTYDTGQFFLGTPDGVTVGSNSTTFGGASAGAFVHNFRHHIPEPATLALLGLGVLALVPRRR